MKHLRHFTYHAWHFLAAAIAFALFGWLFFLRATNTGSLWQWAVVFIALAVVIENLASAIRMLTNRT